MQLPSTTFENETYRLEITRKRPKDHRAHEKIAENKIMF